MSDPNDVTPAPSADPDVPSAQVTSTEAAHADRPVENAVAEFNRKFGKLQSQLDAAIQYMATQRPAPAPAPAPVAAQGEPSDEDLWALAQQGDRRAFETYQRRIAQREIQTALGTQQRTNTVTGQLQALTQKYPVLNDGAHPLTQTVQRAYQLLVQNGYPAGPATLLDAAKTAIADSPDIVSDLYTRTAQTREQGRQSATQRAQSGVMGASPRQEPSPGRQTTKQISPDERALARRMGMTNKRTGRPYTDEELKKAKEHFLERNADGTSNLGAVGGYVNVEDL